MPNYDEKTGIRYGVISPHSINQEALNDIYTNGDDPYYENMEREITDMVNEMVNSTAYTISDETKAGIIERIMDDLSDGYENPDGAMDYSDSEYDLHVSGDNFGIFVMKSPYYTYCRGCSPCAPGAGDLDAPINCDGAGGKNEKSPYQLFSSACTEKTYCLGPEWFDKDDGQYSRKLPYRVFRVDNDQEV